MKDVTKLSNYTTPDSNNIFGRLKDSVYVAGVVSQVGSRILADIVMDLLSLPYYIAYRRGISPNDIADNTSSSQVYDLVFAEIDDHVTDGVTPVAQQIALSSWSRAQQDVADIGPDPIDFDYFTDATGRDGRHLFLYMNVDKEVCVVIYDMGMVLSEHYIGTATTLDRRAFGLITNSTVFAVTGYAARATCWTSSNGEAWVSNIVDSDTARPGGKVLGRIGEKLIIPAYDDSDNSYYTSDDNGTSWTRVALTATTPLYKPIAMASNINYTMWVDESGNYVRYIVSTTWRDAVINGGALVDSINKQIIWSGGRFVIRDNQANIFITREGDAANFDMYASPSGETPTAIFGGNGIIGVLQDNQLYVATEANAVLGNWRVSAVVEGGDDIGYTPPRVMSFDGSQFCLAGSRLSDAASTAVNISAPLVP